MKPGVVGLDLSLLSTGGCWLPKGWRGSPSQARVMTCGRECDGSERDKARRRDDIASRVLAFVAQHVSPGGRVYVEEYAFAKSNQAHAAQIRELGGVVKDRLFVELDVECLPVVASEARKVMLGKLPQMRGVKEWVVDQVRRQMRGDAIYWNEDQIDAMVVANAGLAHEGWVPISFPPV